jgi:hypothetical protein
MACPPVRRRIGCILVWPALLLLAAPSWAGLLDQVTPHDPRALGLGGAPAAPEAALLADPVHPSAVLSQGQQVQGFAQVEDIVSIRKRGARLGRLRSSMFGVASVWPVEGDGDSTRTAVGLRALTGYIPMSYSQPPHFTRLSVRPWGSTLCVAERISPRTRVGLSVDHLALGGVGGSDQLGGWVEAFPGIPEVEFDYADTSILVELDTALRGTSRAGGSLGYSKGAAAVTIRDDDDAVRLHFPADGWSLRARWSGEPAEGTVRWVEGGCSWRRGRGRTLYNTARDLGPTRTRYDAWDLTVAQQRDKPSGRSTCLSIRLWHGDGFARGAIDLQPLGAPLQAPFGVGAYYDLTGEGTILALQGGTEWPTSPRTTLRFGGSYIHSRLRAAFGYQGRVLFGLSSPRRETAYDFRELSALLIGAGVSYDTGNGRVEYGIGQYVPLRSRQLSEPIAGPPPAVPREPHRTRGGTVHSLCYTMAL